MNTPKKSFSSTFDEIKHSSVQMTTFYNAIDQFAIINKICETILLILQQQKNEK